jgi:antitoxin component YwqK of YwqJK toxin-antitoxin module
MRPDNYKVLLLFILLSVGCSTQNSKPDIHNEENYYEINRGKEGKLNVIVLQFKYDSSYTIKKIYPDSLYSDSAFLMIKHFFHRNTLDGPWENYSDGILTGKGTMKANKYHGEQLRFSKNGVLTSKSYYDIGIRVGVWEYFYHSTGKIFKRVYYDTKGKFVKQEIYDRKGKLARVENEPIT